MAQSDLGSTEWQHAVARLIMAGASAQATPALIAALSQLVDHQGTCLLAFHRDAPPEVVHHTLEPAGARHYLDRYLAGPYLLDPLYQLAMQASKPGSCRYRDEAPDRFRSSEYYRQYCERTHLGDEIDFLLDVEDACTLALVVARREKRFSRAEMSRLVQIEPVVHAAMRNIWLSRVASNRPRARDTSVHRRLIQCFNNFGAGSLTEREQEITQLLLRGFSTKAIARELGIAPGTVMVHKRNLFAKLEITSQYELFSRFIDRLTKA
jgi:DNA-binding CsgD family transcriptional regulator